MGDTYSTPLPNSWGQPHCHWPTEPGQLPVASLGPCRVRAVVACAPAGWVEGTLGCISSERPSAGTVPVHTPAPTGAGGTAASLGVCPGCRSVLGCIPGLPRDCGTAQHGPWWEQPTLAALPLPLATRGDPTHHPPPPATPVSLHSAPTCICTVSLSTLPLLRELDAFLNCV